MTNSESDALDEDSVSGGDRKATRHSSFLALFSILPLHIPLIGMTFGREDCGPISLAGALTRAFD